MSVISHNGKVVVAGGKSLSFDNLISIANETTGQSDTTLTDAVQSLVDGFGGGGNVPALSKCVKFIDYDGSIVATWETSSVASKTALPDNPTHDGLTAQGWNWSLAEIQSYIADYPDSLVVVGQMYITDDGKTRIYIHLEEGRSSPYLGICPNGSVDIDWGDGSAHDTVTGTSVTTVKNTKHTYASGGDYIISLTVTGSMGIAGSSSYGSQLLWKNEKTNYINYVYQNSIQKVAIGSSVTSIGTYAFYNCYSLTSVTIPNNITSIGERAFNSCYCLTSITIPNNVTSISRNAFYYCYSLTSVTIPNNVTSIGDNAFYNCSSLASITIPNSVTSIGKTVFNYCNSLTSITIPNSVTSISDNAFSSCNSLTSVIISNNVTSIGSSAFSGCNSLTSITIPNSVTSIGTYAFYNCYSLTSIAIPNNITRIVSSAFGCCYGLGFIKFTSQTPPTISGSTVFSSAPTDCIIYVPAGTLSAYTSATNYPSPSTYTYVEY